MPHLACPSRRLPVALTIAGSDSGGGAGIQADIKTFAACGVHGASAVTALTAQNTLGVQGVHEVPPDFVADQIDSVADDLGVDAAKTGMLASAAIIDLVADRVRHHGIERLVVDPVMIAQSGDPLLRDDAVRALTGQLLPLAQVVTPNLPEADRLLGRTISAVDEFRDAAKALRDLGPASVLLKGGHFPDGDCLDLFFDGEDFLELRAERLETTTTHGTGCTMAAAVAARLAAGEDLTDAVRFAKDFITDAIRYGLTEGKGYGCVNPPGRLWREAETYPMVEALEGAVEQLQEARLGRLVAEVQMNFGYAFDGAVGPEEVVAIPGRIVRLGDSLQPVGAPRFGSSLHVANLILTAQQHDPTIRSAMNVRFSEEHLEACRAAGLHVAEFSRAEETEEIKRREGSSLSFGVALTARREGCVPDILFDHGDVGKEPMIRVFGTDPADVVDKVLRMVAKLDERDD